MSTMALQTNKSINDYGAGIKKLLLDIKKEIEDGTKDGIGMQLASQKGDEASVYNFLKNQGYEITYKDFLIFNKDSKKIVEENEKALRSMLEEQKSEELSDSDLEQVAGGLEWWQWLLVGIGSLIVLAAITIVTLGAATVALGGVLNGILATTYVAAGLGTVGGAAITVGTIS